MNLETRYCPECREDQLFEQPHQAGGCPDTGDGELGDCPELACTECGFALVIAFTAGGGVAGIGKPGRAGGGFGERAA